MSARWQRALATVGDRLHGEEDRRASSRGWTVRRTGWLGLGRTYADPRWSSRPAAPDTTDGGPQS